MREKEKILILSATFGDGHKQVAEAISDVVEGSLQNYEAVTLDVMEWIHPYLTPISTYIYKNGIKKFPHIYRYLYSKTRERNAFSTKLNALFLFGMDALIDIIQKVKPVVIVSTYPFAAGMVSKLKEQKLIHVPAVTIITDYTDHSYWIYPSTDLYLVGSAQVRNQLILRGVEEAKIKVTGIPVRSKFNNHQPKDRLLAKYGIKSNKFTILVMGGGDGFIDNGMSIFHSMKSISANVQLIVVCGRNAKLKQKLELEFKDCKEDVLILGFSENIHELMAIADLMITKPGGVTTTEALIMDLPLLMYHPLPGQEEDNATFLLEAGLAFLAENEADLLGKVEYFFNNSTILKGVKKRTKRFQDKSTSTNALREIVQTIEFAAKEIS